MRVAEFLKTISIEHTPVQDIAVVTLAQMDKIEFRELMREMAVQERFAAALRGYDEEHAAM